MNNEINFDDVPGLTLLSKEHVFDDHDDVIIRLILQDNFPHKRKEAYRSFIIDGTENKLILIYGSHRNNIIFFIRAETINGKISKMCSNNNKYANLSIEDVFEELPEIFRDYVIFNLDILMR